MTVKIIREGTPQPSSSGWTTIYDALPADCRPDSVLISYFTASDNTVLRFRVDVDGKIGLYSIPANTQIGGVITYAV